MKILESKNSKIIALVVGVILIAIASFAVGMAVGFHKARFSYKWGENYERNFIGSPHSPEFMGFPHNFEGRDFRNGYGLAGTIISITDNKLVVKDKEDKENTVSLTDKTTIKQRRDTLKISDLKTGEQVVVIGSPDNEGVVNADLIRVFNEQTNQ